MHMAFFFFNDTATTEIYTLSLHDALPICPAHGRERLLHPLEARRLAAAHERGQRHEHRDHHDGHDRRDDERVLARSEEHTSELQSRQYLVCRLLLEKKKKHSSDLHYRYDL